MFVSTRLVDVCVVSTTAVDVCAVSTTAVAVTISPPGPRYRYPAYFTGRAGDGPNGPPPFWPRTLHPGDVPSVCRPDRRLQLWRQQP